MARCLIHCHQTVHYDWIWTPTILFLYRTFNFCSTCPKHRKYTTLWACSTVAKGMLLVFLVSLPLIGKILINYFFQEVKKHSNRDCLVVAIWQISNKSNIAKRTMDFSFVALATKEQKKLYNMGICLCTTKPIGL